MVPGDINSPELRNDWDSELLRDGNIIVATMRTSAHILAQTGDVKHADSLTRDSLRSTGG